MTHYKIFLVEDREADAEKITESLNELAKERSDDECDFHFELIPGTIEDEYEEEKYLFYDKDVIEPIKKHIEQENDNLEKPDKQRVGLLLDILLTREDLDSNLSSYYPQPGLAKKIYFKFHKQIPVYMITAFSAFAIQSDLIMGVSLAEQYIAKDALLRYKFQDDINKLFNFYRDFKQVESMPEVNHV